MSGDHRQEIYPQELMDAIGEVIDALPEEPMQPTIAAMRRYLVLAMGAGAEALDQAREERRREMSADQLAALRYAEEMDRRNGYYQQVEHRAGQLAAQRRAP